MSAKEQPVYEVSLRSKRVQRELDSLQEPDYQRVVEKIRALTYEARPSGCEKLYDAINRVRVGEFRIIYFTDEKNKRINVGAVRRRSEKTYKDIEDLFR